MSSVQSGQWPIRVTAQLVVLFVFASAAVALPVGVSVPETNARVFMPGVVSTSEHEFGVAVTMDWTEIYFTRLYGDDSRLLKLGRVGDSWSTPEVCSVSRPGGAAHPCLADGGSRLLFVSRRPCPNASAALNVWVSERNGNGWDRPVPLGPPVTDQTVHAPSVSASGSLYATGLVRLRKEDSGYAKPEPLVPPIKGSHPAISPDESFMVFSARRPDGMGSNDLYVIFAQANGEWSAPQNLGPGVNAAQSESSPTLSSDGDCLFFSRGGDIWWISTDVIGRLMPIDARD
jgi:hypothetical protein